MGKVEEITAELDLRQGKRVFLVTMDEDTHRFRLELACETNDALLGGPPDWQPLQQQTVTNQTCKEVLLDLLTALHAQPFAQPLKP